MKDFKLGIQLYSVREPLQKDFRGTLENLKAMGIQGVELAFYYGGMEPDELAEVMKELELEVCGIYEDFANIADANGKVYEYAEALGCTYLTSGFNMKMLEDDFRGAVALAEKAAAVAKANNITVCYHAHAHEFATVNGESYLDRLLKAVPAMAYEADTAWIHCGGEDVMKNLRQYGDRIPLLHVKDVKADNSITELGNGVIDFQPIIEFAAESQIQWVSYEQDTSELTPLESAQLSISFIRNLLSCNV